MTLKCNDQWDDQMAEIYEQHRGSLVATAQRLVGNSGLAEEAVHEAFIRFDKSAGTTVVIHELAYLRTIVTNVSRSMLRRRQHADRWRCEDPRHDVAPDEVYLAHETNGEVQAACALLPEQQRKVIEMRYWQDLSEAEIAAQLNVSTGTVKTHASRARQTLRALLDDPTNDAAKAPCSV